MNDTVNVADVNDDRPKLPVGKRPPRAKRSQPSKVVHFGNEESDVVYEVVDVDNEVEVNDDPATSIGCITSLNNDKRLQVSCVIETLRVIFNFILGITNSRSGFVQREELQ
jgi:hypothetical protein